jgi:3-hexulose-6-phosphate synthase
MKLQIAFDITDLDKALSIAHKVHEYADIIEVGSLLIYNHGMQAVEAFRKEFPEKTISVDSKIADRSKDIVTLISQAEPDWMTVLAGTSQSVIHNACLVAHEHGKKIMLDLIDTKSFGQAALEAKSLGVDALLFHRPLDEDNSSHIAENWDMVRGNTTLPVFISTRITRENIASVAAYNPDGIVIGTSIVQADNPEEEAQYFYNIINS